MQIGEPSVEPAMVERQHLATFYEEELPHCYCVERRSLVNAAPVVRRKEMRMQLVGVSCEKVAV